MTDDPRFIFLQRLADQGGPVPEEDALLSATIAELYADFKAGAIPAPTLKALHAVLPFTRDTIQGFALLKPNGYVGCYEMMERIYGRAHSGDPKHYNWDRYCQTRAPSRAVRNRKDYFIEEVHRAVGAASGKLVKLLNIASGPGRDLKELFDSCPQLRVEVVCVEQDPRAIAHATKVCAEHISHIEFVQANALTFATERTFDLIWSAGLFDYLSDDYFNHLLRKLFERLNPEGELIIGNFCRTNPALPYMEFMEWSLHHRTADELRSLAAEFAPVASIAVRAEPAQVNLFLHLRKLGL
jgi:extracellular factor (EF) 3-hydroxypalmitic acid methyl ester biosynthesis protein